MLLICLTKFGHIKTPASPQYLMTVPLHLELYNILLLNVQYRCDEYVIFQVLALFEIVDCSFNLLF